MKYMKSTPANIQAAVDEMNAELGGQYVTADAHWQHLANAAISTAIVAGLVAAYWLAAILELA